MYACIRTFGESKQGFFLVSSQIVPFGVEIDKNQFILWFQKITFFWNVDCSIVLTGCWSRFFTDLKYARVTLKYKNINKSFTNVKLLMGMLIVIV